MALKKRRIENLISHLLRALPIPSKILICITAVTPCFVSVNNFLHAQPASSKGPAEASKPSNGLADTSKVVVDDEYWNDSEKKSALFDSSGRQLSTQQMVDFLKSELRKLNEQINAIGHKASPDSSKDSNANDVDVMKLFIIKGKLESMEKTLDEWTMQRDKELNSDQNKSSSDNPKKNKK